MDSSAVTSSSMVATPAMGTGAVPLRTSRSWAFGEMVFPDVYYIPAGVRAYNYEYSRTTGGSCAGSVCWILAHNRVPTSSVPYVLLGGTMSPVEHPHWEIVSHGYITHDHFSAVMHLTGAAKPLRLFYYFQDAGRFTVSYAES